MNQLAFAENERVFGGKRVLVTGGLGFIGSNLAHRLVSLGAHVTIVDALFPEYGGNRANLNGISDRVTTVVGDIGEPAVSDAVVHGQDFIFNLAGQISHTQSMTRPLRDLYVNAQCHLALLESCRRHNQSARIVYASTRSVYGRVMQIPVTETVLPQPVDINGVDKLCGEQYHLVFHKAYGLRTSALRLTNTYGPRMRPGKIAFINLFVQLALDSQTISVFGDGAMVRDLLYVDDAVSAFLAIAASDACDGEIYNVGSGQPVTVLEVANRTVESVGSGQVKLIPYPREHKVVEVGDFLADISKIQAAVGWEPQVGLPEGLKATSQFLHDFRDIYWPGNEQATIGI